MPSLSRESSCSDVGFTLRQTFGKADFRPHQREIIQAALEGSDIYVQAATSFGKSLCFQLPAVINSGITLVVCPLLSLMIDQIRALQAAGVEARALNSNTPWEEQQKITRDLESGHPMTRLLYVTPEKCSAPRFRELLQVVYTQKEFARLAIDEAHCISEWGHDFRKDFKKLSWFRETLPEVPIMCLTATANPQIRTDILSVLGMDPSPDKTRTFLMSPHRANLHLEIRYTQDADDVRLADFLQWIRGVHERRKAGARAQQLAEAGERYDNVPGIIYTITRDECESLASELRAAGIGARAFHAKLAHDRKQETLDRWNANVPGYDVIVATTAFGMGIDKDNVRYVVHWRLPKSFEGYYQEAGRAGRDGNASYCFLYYSREDLARVQSMIGGGGGGGGASRDGGNWEARQRSLTALAKYCENTDECRHALICQYFGETKRPACDYACDWHKDADDLERRFLRGLASEEWVSTQAMQGTYDDYYDE